MTTDVESPLLVSVPATDVSRVVENLVRNAIKFTPAGGRVAIRAQRVREGVLLEVEDSGRGLTEEEIGKLFQPYAQSRLEDARRGQGLGLFICKSLVESHGGQIWIESEGPEKGSRFVVLLPGQGAQVRELLER